MQPRLRGDTGARHKAGGTTPLSETEGSFLSWGWGKWFFYWRRRVDSAPPGIGGGQHPSREERRDDALPRDKWDDMLLFESKRGRRLSHGRKEDIAPPRDSRGMACSLLRKEVERGCSLPLLLPPPSFFFSPLFFWRGPQVSPVHTKKLPGSAPFLSEQAKPGEAAGEAHLLPQYCILT